MSEKVYHGMNLSEGLKTVYAQTNLQLLNQLRREGCSEVDLRLIRDAYEISTRLYAGYFTGSGRTQIAHVVGTASILSSVRAPTAVVAAGLLHNVYTNGDFGSPARGVAAAKRKEVSRVVGAEVEKYVYRFRELRMKPKIALSLLSGAEMLDDLSRHTLMIELAERLEHGLNHEGREYMTRNGRLMIQAANRLGLPALAAKIREALEKTIQDQRLEDLIHRARGHRSDFLAPPSYRRRLWIGALSRVCYLRSSLRGARESVARSGHFAQPIRPSNSFTLKPYAQTNIQLLAQLGREAYPDHELDCVCNAHKLATRLFTGLYRPSGKEFMAHAVGTASILGSLRVHGRIVAAALLHAAYEHGDFGNGSKGISETKREKVRLRVGEEVEQYVARYYALQWNKKTIHGIRESIAVVDATGRDVLLMRLANQLEDLLDLGPLYCFSAENKRRHYLRQGPLMIDIAERLGFPTLARELARALEETASSKVSAELRSRREGVVLIPPRSYCRRTRVLLCLESTRVFERLRSMTKVKNSIS